MKKLRSPLPLALLAFSCCFAKDSTRADSSVLVHVNQVALERAGPKAAIVEYALRVLANANDPITRQVLDTIDRRRAAIS